MSLLRLLVSATSQKTRTLRRRVERSLKRRGMAGTFAFCMRNIPSVAVEIISSRTSAGTSQSEFDRTFHVDTSGEIHLTDLDIQSPNSAFGNSYQPSLPKEFFEMLGTINIRHSDYTFIDFGSGKGLVLLLASTCPFRRIIGVEFSPELHQIAEQNIRNYQNPAQQCQNVKSLLGDVLEFHIPEEPEVLYLFNPFDENVMKVLVANIRKSLESHPRPMFVLYKNPIANAVFEREKLLTTVRITRHYAIYKH